MEKTSLEVNELKEGESIEQKVERLMNNDGGIKDTAPIIYTDRKMGVVPEYNIRSDRFDLAVDAMDKISQARLARRKNAYKDREVTKVTKKSEDGGAESTQGKGESGDSPTT